ncbi:hypothetical protein SALWKB12_1322 [Snodgrassella communis]|uniref:Uncharacterized protein n=1 Tax=Snodgrassella communis TaxID=2946699 RepID=A0A836Z5M7_9NEIS|nr:hypothetical protein SALWKB12_1322 [Snodgrassella communis]KDN15024.1 hypothetical protein SALWKB29_1096 [Snodgrassella communis]
MGRCGAISSDCCGVMVDFAGAIAILILLRNLYVVFYLGI